MKGNLQFLSDLADSRRAVDRFVRELNDTGVYAEHLPQKTRGEHEEAQRMKYSDGGDLAVCFRVEHKVRTLRFRDANSFPFPTLYVDEVYKFDKNARENDLPLLAYVIESADHLCAAVVYNWTQPHWRVATNRWDPKQNRFCDYYEIDKKFVRFCAPAEVFGLRAMVSQI